MSVPDVAIAVLPYEHRQGRDMAQTPLDDLHWPLGRPERLADGTVADLGSQDHLIVYPRTVTHVHARRGVRARVSLLMGEPAAIHGKHIALLHLTGRRFWRVLTFNDTLLRRLPNAVLMPYGTTWVPNWRDLSLKKTRMISLIASAKRGSAGHKLRHAIADWLGDTGRDDVDVIGGGYAPFEEKSDGLAPYRYSVVIENVRERNYFSEKLIDAILCDTVPIYWGCPNIADFLPTDGMVICQSEADIRRAIDACTPEDYARRIGALRAIKPRAEGFCDLERRAAQAIAESL